MVTMEPSKNSTTTWVNLKPQRRLINPNFQGYKLSLDVLPITCCSLTKKPSHHQPDSDQFGFLHSKLFGDLNHLVMDPHNPGICYYIGGSSVLCVGAGQKEGKVWTIPETGGRQRYNPHLVLAAKDVSLVSDGTGFLFVLDTGDRSLGRQWKTSFQGQVCGKETSFVVKAGWSGEREGKEELEVVLEYVEERDSVEGERLPEVKQGASSFLCCEEWVSFVRSGSGCWVMERVRRLVSQGAFNYVAVNEGEREAVLIVACEKNAVMVFDSMNPSEEDFTVKEEEGEKQGDPGFYWKQTEEDLELWLYISTDISKKGVSVNVSAGHLSVAAAGAILVEGQLEGGVDEEYVTWTLGGGKLVVMLQKQHFGLTWGGLWGLGGGSLGEEVNDDSADTFLSHLSTDNPVAVEDLQAQHTFNWQELEECDKCPDQGSSFMWFSSGRMPTHASSLAGHAHLMVVSQVGVGLPAICTRHDVDAFVWQPGRFCLEHTATFAALGYVQASKQQRKFLAAPHDSCYSVIVDASRHVYLYRQPRAMEGSELRNRKSGQKVEGVAVQQVITFDSTDEIVGVAAMPTLLMVLTTNSLYQVQIMAE